MVLRKNHEKKVVLLIGLFVRRDDENKPTAEENSLKQIFHKENW